MTRYIDADALVYSRVRIAHEDGTIGGYNAVVMSSEIKNAPTIDAEPVRHGKWIDGHCSICGCDVPAYIIDWKWQKDMNARFCPMCGARMDDE